MENFVNNLIENKLNNIHTTIPAQVKKVNLSSVDIKPLFYKFTEAGEKIEHPIVREVPVINFSTQNSEIKLPINKGDKGLYFVCERDISDILKGGSEIGSTRKFDLTDGFFMPVNFSEGKEISKKNLEIINGKSTISISPNGQMKIEGIQDLLGLIVELLDLFLNNASNFGVVIDPQSGAPIPNNLGASPVPAQASAIKAKLESMRLK